MGEDLDDVVPRPGLGLVGFAVDVHAAQWGTVGRLVHAVCAYRVESAGVGRATATVVRP